MTSQLVCDSLLGWNLDSWKGDIHIFLQTDFFISFAFSHFSLWELLVVTVPPLRRLSVEIHNSFEFCPNPAFWQASLCQKETCQNAKPGQNSNEWAFRGQNYMVRAWEKLQVLEKHGKDWDGLVNPKSLYPPQHQQRWTKHDCSVNRRRITKSATTVLVLL